jgi:predicted Abi (CAAX) family protease
MVRILNVVVDGQMHVVNVEEDTILSGSTLFNKMDGDMNKGWTLGKDFVESLSVTERCQVVGDKLLTALEDNNEQMKTMMAAYILSRVPNIMTIHLDNTGEIQETQLELA